MKMNFAAVLTVGLVTVFNVSAHAAETLSFSDARVIEPMKGTTVTAAYAVIKNDSEKSVKVTIAEAAPFKAAEVHETYEANGKSGMRQLEQITIPAHGVFELKPGGNHIMLFDPARTLKLGEIVNIKFMVDGKSTMAKFKVVVRDEKMEEHMHHHATALIRSAKSLGQFS